MSGNSGDFDVAMDEEDVNLIDKNSAAQPGQGFPNSTPMATGIVTPGSSSDNSYYATPNYPRLPPSDYADWSYHMRRNMQEIIPGLFLGPYASATKKKLDDMKEAGLTHVVCVRQILERNLVRANHPQSFEYLVVEFADTLTDNIIPHFKVTNQFIDNALNNGGKVLVHGNGGVSRSGALVIAYIMARYGVTCKQAFTFVQQRRFCVNPNENFLAQLREYEPIYQAFHTVPLELPQMESNAYRPCKRSLDENEDEMGEGEHENKARALDPNEPVSMQE